MKSTTKQGIFRISIGLFCAALISLLLITLIPFFDETLVPLFYSMFPNDCIATSQPVYISDEIQNPANLKQPSANVIMSTYKGALYFFPNWYAETSQRTKFHKHLSVFTDGTAKRLIKINQPCIGMSRGYFYYFVDDCTVGCYNISDGSSFLIDTGNIYSFEFRADEKLQLLTNHRDLEYCLVDNGVLQTRTRLPETFLLNNITYVISDTGSANEIFAQDSSGKTESLNGTIPWGEKTIIPCQAGLLVHNIGQGELLYLIHENGNDIIELFSAPCYRSDSTLNVWENFAYLSLCRFQYNEATDSSVQIENDKFSGTFRINLNDFSVTKISDKFYSGLYIFDNTGIFACDQECNIYKLDFDGDVKMVLLE